MTRIWSSNCVISNSTGERTFPTIYTKLYVPVVTLSKQENANFQQLKFGFKRTVNWNKYQSDPRTYKRNRYLNHLVNPSLQGMNRVFVSSYENKADRRSHSSYYPPKVTIKNYNVIIDDKNFFLITQ